MIASELEKLVLLRDKGDLSQEEFGKAKERLLSNGEERGLQIRAEDTPLYLKNGGEGKPERLLFIAIISTISAVFAAGSAIIDTSPISSLAFILFTVAASLNWVELSKRRGRK